MRQARPQVIVNAAAYTAVDAPKNPYEYVVEKPLWEPHVKTHTAEEAYENVLAVRAVTTSDFMTAEVVFAAPAESVAILMGRMTDRRIRHRIDGGVGIGRLALACHLAPNVLGQSRRGPEYMAGRRAGRAVQVDGGVDGDAGSAAHVSEARPRQSCSYSSATASHR